MKETKVRSWTKSITWRIIGFIILFILTGSWEVSIIFHAIRFVLYFFHERIWNKFDWGVRSE